MAVSVKVKVTLPAATPVITPALVTVANEVLLLAQVPPELGDKLAVLPTQTEAGAVTVGNGLMVTELVVLLQPVVAEVNVKVTLPAATPVMTPALVTVAKEISLLTQVPPDVGDNVAVLPIHTEAGEVTAGSALTVTAEVAFVQPVAVSVKVNVTLPAATPVITPALVTVAKEVLLLAQVPPVVGDRVAVLPTQTVAGAETTGSAFTVTAVVVLLQPVEVTVKVNVTLPGAIPVMTPAFVTVAIAGLLLTQVPPVVGDKVLVLPTQTEAGAVTTGKALTVTEVVVLLQPVEVSVKVNVTVPAASPVTSPALLMVALVGSLLAHVPPEFGVRLIVLPIQTEVGPPKTGRAFTVTTTG